MAGIFSEFSHSARILDLNFVGHRDRFSQAGLVWISSILYPLSQLVLMDLELLCWRPLAFQRLLSWSFSLLMALTGLKMAALLRPLVLYGLLLMFCTSGNDEDRDLLVILIFSIGFLFL
ncbi:hypothetical protein TNCT_374951 [Trichonephila clavata]|uniref:Uncharacterized protein n=1 Tax=Trichonephila clavata TaxID=2740835 RepID=A0A8X6HPF0_TRICU|nr:hypothetical protein TNCT_374951 [Trichonephila clavata]